MSKDRAKMAYETYRAGINNCPHPPWEQAAPWIRDIVTVGYLQGTLDGAIRPDDACECGHPRKDHAGGNGGCILTPDPDHDKDSDGHGGAGRCDRFRRALNA